MGSRIGHRPPEGEFPEEISKKTQETEKGHEQKVDTLFKKQMGGPPPERQPRLGKVIPRPIAKEEVDLSQLQKSAERLKIKYEHLRDFLSFFPKINKDNADRYAEAIIRILKPVSPDQQREFVQFLSEKIEDTPTAYRFLEAFTSRQELESVERALKDLRDFC